MQAYCFATLLLAVVSETNQVSVAPGIFKEDSLEWDPVSLYYTLQSVLDIWQSPRFHYQKEPRDLLSLFKHRCFSTPESWDPDEPFGSRRPFINIEGNANAIRDHIGRRVAEALKGKFLENPPHCLVPFKSVYADGHQLHLPYMALGMYASCHAVKAFWGNTSVVMTGYWNDLAAATLADLFINETIPRAVSTLYDFPKDLVKPDYTFFVDTLNHVPDSREETRLPQWKSKFTEAFLRFRDIRLSRVIWFGADNATDTILQQIEELVEVDKILEIP